MRPQCSTSLPHDALLPVREALESMVPIPEDEWLFARAHIRSLQLPKGHPLICKGDLVDKLYYVCEGLMRVYYTKGDREINRSFVFADRFFTNSISFRGQIPSHYTVQALEDTSLFYFTYDVVQTAYGRHSCWERFGRLMAQEEFLQKELKEWRFRRFTPEEHYQFLLSEDPRFIHHIPQYHLASYLGITPETLSRIRSRMHK